MVSEPTSRTTTLTGNDNEERRLNHDGGEHRTRGGAETFGHVCDPLVMSVVSLQSIQDALEKEIQNFEEIGGAPISLSDNFSTGPAFSEDFIFDDPTIIEHNHKRELNIDGTEQNGRQPRAVQSTRLTEEVCLLKTKLEEVSVLIKAKEHQITELESISNQRGVSASVSLKEKCREMEIELEGLFKEKIEYEIKHLIVVKTTQALNVAFEDQISLFEEQKSLAGEQIQMIHKLKDAEHRALVLKNHAEELEASCQELLATEEILKMQNRFYEHTLYLTAQVIILLIMFVFFMLRPRTSGIVPT